MAWNRATRLCGEQARLTSTGVPTVAPSYGQPRPTGLAG